MNYKNIIKSRKTRIKIMQFLSFIPDRQMVSLQYRIKTGHKLDLKNPKRFTEKIQWYKLYYRDPLMAQCADKCEVRKYVEDCGLGSILNTVYGVYETPDEISADSLPNEFVLKDTLGGGGNSVIIVKDKSRLDWNSAYIQMKEWVNDGRKHRIIVEKYIKSDPNEGGLIDYKFFCFNGKAEYVYVVADRQVGKKAGFGIYNADYVKLDAVRADEMPLTRNLEKPKNYDEMKRMAETLAKPFPEARIDFYNVNNQVLFGEITFFDGSGYMRFEPDEFDFMLGEKFEIDLAKGEYRNIC